MTNQAFPSLNGVAPSWADIQTTITPDGATALQTIDYSAIKWGRKVEVGEQRGASGGRIMARTTGALTPEAEATFYRSGYRALLKSLMQNAPTRGNQVIISGVSFDILIQHSVPGDTEIYTTKLKGCRLLGDSDDMKEGSEADQLTLTLNPIEIVNIIGGVEVAML